MHFRPVSWLPSAKPIVQICPAQAHRLQTSYAFPKKVWGIHIFIPSFHGFMVLWVLSILTFHYEFSPFIIHSFIMDPYYERVCHKKTSLSLSPLCAKGPGFTAIVKAKGLAASSSSSSLVAKMQLMHRMLDSVWKLL